MNGITSDTTVIILFVTIVVAGIIVISRLTKNNTRRASNLRYFIQIVAVFAIFMGLLIGPFNSPQSIWGPLGISPRDRLIGQNLLGTQFPDGISFPVLACYYPNGRTVTCPIWQIQAYIFPFWDYPRGYDVLYSISGLEMLAIVFSLLIFASIILGRFFCGWLCPFGLYQDLLTSIRKVFKKRHLTVSPKTNAKLGQARWIIIAAFLTLSVIFGSYAIFGTEIIPGTNPTTGHDALHSGITSYINEPYCLICPARPLCILVESALGLVNWSYISQITYGPFYMSGFYVTSLNLSVLIAVTILAIIYRRFWCRVCPLGALTALFSAYKPFNRIALTKIEKNEKKCTKCGICKRVCPTDVTEVYERKGGDVTVSNCMLCMRCVEMCPYKDALKWTFAGKTVMQSRFD